MEENEYWWRDPVTKQWKQASYDPSGKKKPHIAQSPGELVERLIRDKDADGLLRFMMAEVARGKLTDYLDSDHFQTHMFLPLQQYLGKRALWTAASGVVAPFVARSWRDIYNMLTTKEAVTGACVGGGTGKCPMPRATARPLQAWLLGTPLVNPGRPLQYDYLQSPYLPAWATVFHGVPKLLDHPFWYLCEKCQTAVCKCGKNLFVDHVPQVVNNFFSGVCLRCQRMHPAKYTVPKLIGKASHLTELRRSMKGGLFFG
jgi:hypothetical protein